MSQSVTDNPINLWYTRCGAATASALAIRKGWLQEEFAQGGTALHSLRDSESLEVRNSHYHHKQSGMFREGGNIPPLWAKGLGQDTVVVGITWLDEYQGILTRADSGIRDLGDLKGKRLGIPLHKNAVIDFQRGAAQHGFETVLSLIGHSTDSAVLVDIDAPSYDLQDGPRRTSENRQYSVELEALERGDVDAVFLRFARGYRASQDPRFHELINLNTLKDPLLRVNNGTPRPVTVDRAFLDKHPEVVARYLAVLLRTAAWAEKNHDEVVSLLAQDNSAASIADVLASHGPKVHLSFTPKLSEDYILGLNEQKEFLRRWGYIKHDYNVRDWIVAEPLAEAHKLFKAQPEFSASVSTKVA
jgi:ABC-type nitrate/sulfonate/bicarbonate transport system substrate-binding protein